MTVVRFSAASDASLLRNSTSKVYIYCSKGILWSRNCRTEGWMRELKRLRRNLVMLRLGRNDLSVGMTICASNLVDMRF